MVYGMAWLARHGIWYGLACMALYIVWPDGHGMFMLLPGGHDMVCGMAWRE